MKKKQKRAQRKSISDKKNTIAITKNKKQINMIFEFQLNFCNGISNSVN